MKKTILFLSIIICTALTTSAQVTDVKYLIEYNDSSNLYDCKIVIIDGEATTYPQRIQFNTQYTIVVPTGTTLTIESLHAPLEDNQDYMGTVPCLWEFGPSEIAPPITPELDYYRINPNLSPPSAYNNLSQGDTILLFSLGADVNPCDNALRAFMNGIDPSSLEMPSGGDFSNGFTIGSATQIYSGNLISNYNNNYIADSDSLFICNGDCVILDPTILCNTDTLIYEWSTEDTTEVIEVCPVESTNYYLLLKDSTDMIVDSLTLYIEVDSLVISLQDTIICENEMTVAMSNISGGTWESTNLSVATIDSITGVISTIDWGAAIFKYTAPNGCMAFSELLIVTEGPTVDVPEIFCVGSTAMATSENEGIWKSSDPDIATITADGEITALSAGITTITFNDTLSECPAVVDVEVIEEQMVSNTGSDTLCVGGFTALSPSTGGIWALTFSSSAGVASVDIEGIVTGLGGGKAVFSFISDAPGCGATATDTISVFDLPNVTILGDDRLCIGDTATISPNPGAMWALSDPSVASVDVITGVITGLASGSTTITLTDSITGCSATSNSITVEPNPIVSAEITTLCVGAVSSIISSSVGTWSALNTGIAALDSISIVGISEGEAGFIFTDDSTGCVSDTLFISVLPKPETNLTGPSEICINEMTTIEPSTGGTWTSSDPVVASIDNLGNITGITSGKATFTFTSTATSCASEPSEEVMVFPNPIDSIGGEFAICLGTTATIFSDSLEGKWISENPEIATIDSLTSVITPVSVGMTTIVYTDDVTGCASSFDLEVYDMPIGEFIGDSIICIGVTTMMAPSTGGTWMSADPTIAQIDVDGIAVGISEGTTTFSFTDFNGCTSESYFIEVLSASDPLCIVGIGETDLAEISIFPNPTRDIVNIESVSSIESVVIFNYEFQRVEEVVFKNHLSKHQISLVDLTQGLYILAIKSGSDIIYKKILKD